jgi:hypothetical protein
LTGATFDNVALIDAAGAAAPVTLSATAAGTFYTGTGSGDAATAEGVLLQGYLLESSPTLGATANWGAVTGSPNPIPGAGTFNVQSPAGGGYYRFRRNE